MNFINNTEKDSLHRNLETKSVSELLHLMNEEDQKVAIAVKECLPAISKLIEDLVMKLKQGGRLFYIGAGSSGRLGILDASECPPTFGVSNDLVIGLIAGGDKAIRTAVEFAEDNKEQAWKDLQPYLPDEFDTVIGIAASGTTPYVVHGLKACRDHKIMTACITSNPGSPVTSYSDHKIEVQLGPEFISGSTRLKSGTAQKMILNMISTIVMIGIGRIADNKMVDMQLNNEKLVRRGVRIIMTQTNLSENDARALLVTSGSVRQALVDFHSKKADF